MTCRCEVCRRLAEAERAKGYPAIQESGGPTPMPRPAHTRRVRVPRSSTLSTRDSKEPHGNAPRSLPKSERVTYGPPTRENAVEARGTTTLRGYD